MIHIIVAIDSNNGIGRDGDMLFHISADLRRFKALTMGHTLIMGRRTFDSLPKGALPGRRNIVISRQSSWSAPNTERAASLDDAIAMAGNDDIFVMGGGQIYALAMPLADQLDITHIDADGGCADTFFPEIGNEWQLIDEETADTEIPVRFATYKRKK